MLKFILTIYLLIISFDSFSQNETKKNIDYRRIYSKLFFEEWHTNSEFTPLSNDTLKTLQEIIEILQPYPYKNRNEASDHVEIHTKLDENGVALTEEQILEECNQLSNPVREIADSLKFLFYDSRLTIIFVDSISQPMSGRHRKIIFKPQLRGKVLFIDNKNSHVFDSILRAIRIDNPNAAGQVENIRGIWYGYYHWNAPFNRHMQELISNKCLNYSYDYGELTPIDPIRTITLTKDLSEAIVFQKPYEYSPQMVRLKKICGKWVIFE
ncbi:hypothetical protein [Marinifilum fragile]|uniref:hypothetical protein n=1 Tax=Marinifilum fragile TaxID=570161 RepID=UPI002AA871D0|nr:hypothetical protein [Marinifilum fragile]